MIQPCRVLRVFSVFAFLTCFVPLFARAGTWVAFQNSYTRGTGAPVTVTNTFTLLNPNTQYTLKAYNGGLQNDTTELVSNSVVYLNGAQVLGPANFNQGVVEVNVTIFSGLSNTLSVQVRGKPGGLLTIEVIGVDNDPPTVTASLSPSPNAAGWNNSPVTVTFTCSDKTSGVASCPSPFTVSTEGANQVVSGTATDLAGNTASTSVTINLDMTPPTITGTINPPPDSGGYNSGPVTVTFSCADALSGVASCSAPVSITGEGSSPETGTAVDVAGNTATTTVTVNISFSYFKIQSWQTGPNGNAQSPSGKCLDYGSQGTGGATVYLNDCSSAHPIRVVEVGVPKLDSNGNPVLDSAGNPVLAPRTGSGGTPLTHEVMLFAGSNVIGIHNPSVITADGSSPAPATSSQPALEPQVPWNSPHAIALYSVPANQIFRLDGDSIILEGTSVDPTTNLVVPGPCINTDALACPAPPPQLVIQVQNAHGANGSPLAVSVRNLSDNEFWDFVPETSSRPYPTGGFQPVASPFPDALWNALCASPQVKVGIYPPLISDLGQSDDGMPLTSTCSTPSQGWGSVLLISSPTDCFGVPGPLPGQTQDIGGCLDLSGYPPVIVPAGVTLRGNRRGTNFGPQLYFSFLEWHNLSTDLSPRPGSCSIAACMFEVRGDYVRFTGLRLRGESRSKDSNQFGEATAIQVDFPGMPTAPLFPLQTTTQFIATIDHNDVSDWAKTAINVVGPYEIEESTNTCTYPYSGHTYPQKPCTADIGFRDMNTGALVQARVYDDPASQANAHLARNFLHHNEENNNGYGVGTSWGGRAFIEANVFDLNRHSIAADGEPHEEYRAAYNLVLSSSPTGDQDFDMHGSNGGYSDNGGAASTAGFYVDIVGNTFLATDRADYWLRAIPVLNTDFQLNVSLRNQSLTSSGDAVVFHPCPPITLSCGVSGFPINISADNQFGASDPTIRLGPASLGVGDFDGDGDDDLFLTTGASWYYSPAGSREWRFLSAKVDRIDTLLLGDFDGDGRTDVVGMNPSGQFDVSWGGVSDWEVINQSPCANGVPNPCPTSVQNMVVGDFDGDGTPDILYTDKVHWYISYGGTTPFTQVNDSSFLVQDLRFGHFAICGAGVETDVFSVQGSGWNVSCGATTGWQPLEVALTKTIDGLVVADFNGDGFADVLAPSSDGWQISYGGTQPWTDVAQPFGAFTFVALAGVGHFTGQRQADVLLWNGIGPFFSITGTELSVSAAGLSPATPYSTQDMR